MESRHGQLLNVHGKPVKHAGFTFMPAHVLLEGTSFGLGYRLRDHVGEGGPPALRHAVENDFDAAWVRARIPETFGFVPEKSEFEKGLLDAGFVAVPSVGTVCYPFSCTDHYGVTGLTFSDAGPDEAFKGLIAAGFWGLLLLNPDGLTDFEERVYHSGTGLWLNLGCEAGRVYSEESEEQLGEETGARRVS